MTRAVALIPALNENATIRDVSQRTLRHLSTVVVVDDGSTDGTADALSGLPLEVLRNLRTRGKGASLWRGFRRALELGADAVVTLDGDGQHQPEDIPRLLAAHARQSSAIVIGCRLHDRANMPLDRYLANRLGNFWIGWAAGRAIEDSQSGFRVYPAALLREMSAHVNRSEGFVFESEILIDAARAGTDVIAVPIPAIYESRGRRSHFRPVVDFALIGRMVAWKIISRGFDPAGLVRSLREPKRPESGKAAL